jgi:hypothetical protein
MSAVFSGSWPSPDSWITDSDPHAPGDCEHENGTEMVRAESPYHAHLCVDCGATESECDDTRCYPNWTDDEEEI